MKPKLCFGFTKCTIYLLLYSLGKLDEIYRFVGEKKRCTEFVNNLYTMLLHYRACITRAYMISTPFKIILEQSMSHVINKSPKAARYITQFVDEQLRVELKDCSDQQVEQTSDKMMELLRYLNDKDIFQKYYTMDLAVRLVERLSISSDYEKCMIAKLKADQGVSFTSSIHIFV